MNDDELDDELSRELGRALGHDPDETPPPERVAQVRAAAAALQRPTHSRRRALLTGGIAAGVGGLAGYLAHDLRTEEPLAQPAVPMEAITFTGEADVSTSALINHTWGTELVIDLAGLEPSRAYDVVFQTPAGDVTAGSLLAVADVVMKCRFNAAPLRADVLAIEVRSPSGDAVLRSDLPVVGDGSA